MPSIINATTTNGVAISPDNSGSLQLATNNGTTAVTIDTSQNVGINLTPASQFSTVRGLGLAGTNGNASYITSGGSQDLVLTSNAYLNTSGNFIYVNTDAVVQQRMTSGVVSWWSAASGTAGTTASLTERMRIDSSGNVGIGTSSPSRRLMVEKSAGAVGFGSPYVQVGAANYANGGYYTIGFGYVGGSYTTAPAEIGAIATDDSGGGKVALTFATRDVTTNTAPTERMRITSAGELLIGKTTYSTSVNGLHFGPADNGANIGLLSITGNSTNSGATAYQLYSTSNSTFRFYVNYAGTIFAQSTTISGISDQRLKENIVDLDVGLDAVMALKPRKFDWKEGKGKDIKGDRGFVAQEFETVFPDLVDEWKDPAPEGEEPYKSVRADLIPVLVKAIQELKAELDTVKAELNTLKNPPVEGTE